MSVAYLASEGAAYQAGRLAASISIPAVGLALLIIGLRERSRSRRRPGPGYPGDDASPRHASGASSALIAIGAVVLAFGIVGNLAANVASKPDEGRQHQSFVVDTTIRVGECITQIDYVAKSFSSRPNNDCAIPANLYELADKGGAYTKCPDGKREDSIYYGYSDEFTNLCFALNLKQDECYLVEGDRNSPRLNVDDCSNARPGEVRVVQRIDGSTEKTQCPPGEKSVSYPVPARVYCLARVG